MRCARASLRAILVLVLLASLAGCFLFRHPAPMGPRVIGTVTEASGSPSLIRRNQSYIIGVQSRIYEGDIVETDDASRARIEMIDHSTIGFGGGSHCIFHHYEFKPGDTTPVASMTFTSGSMRIASAGYDKGKHPTFQVQTPMATIGIHGGELWGGFVFGDGRLDIALVAPGAFDVANDHGSVEVSTAGYGTTVLAGGAPQEPVRWTPDRLRRVQNTTAL